MGRSVPLKTPIRFQIANKINGFVHVSYGTALIQNTLITNHSVISLKESRQLEMVIQNVSLVTADGLSVDLETPTGVTPTNIVFGADWRIQPPTRGLSNGSFLTNFYQCRPIGNMHKTIDFIGDLKSDGCFKWHTPSHGVQKCQKAFIFGGFQAFSMGRL
jgi:hypothetical protein